MTAPVAGGTDLGQAAGTEAGTENRPLSAKRRFIIRQNLGRIVANAGGHGTKIRAKVRGNYD